ncbi:MAG: N-acetyltransferase family protein [Solirubrobacteraceae bacterium]
MPDPTASNVERMTFRAPNAADHSRVCAVLDEWWGGRGAELSALLPPLFFQHFADTSWIVEDEARDLTAFLVGFLSQSRPDEGYIHFVGVAPAQRGAGLARQLYERFFAVCRTHDRDTVRCVTSPANDRSIAFHRALGFEVGDPVPDYDGPGLARVALTRRLG